MRKGLTLAIAILATAVLEYGEAVLAKETDKKTVTVANINVFHGISCFTILSGIQWSTSAMLWWYAKTNSHTARSDH